MQSKLPRSLTKLIPARLIRAMLPVVMRAYAHSKGMSLRRSCDHLDVIRNSRVIRLSIEHSIYVLDIINSFDYYFDAVVPFKYEDINLVDYSTPRYHDVRGLEFNPIMFPSLAEPLITTDQYQAFAELSDGMVVLDLGAYSGLTSIIFAEAVGENGAVIAVEADPVSLECIERNISRFRHRSSTNIKILAGAVWNHNDGIEFSCEGNMGSSATGIVGKNRGPTRSVSSYTLSEIVRIYNLQRVDFIKCDIEGAERLIFKDEEFFQQFSPKIIIEAHIVDGEETTYSCINELEKSGYRCSKIPQYGVNLPLIECLRATPI